MPPNLNDSDFDVESPELQRLTYAFVRRLVPSFGIPDSAVDDIYQAVLMRLSQRDPEKENRIINRPAYVFSVARNEARRYLSTTIRHLRAEPLEAENSVERNVPIAVLSDKFDTVRQVESGILLREIMKALEPEDRELMQLLFIGYSEKEVALRLGVNYSATRKRVSRLREKIRVQLFGHPSAEAT